MKKILYSFVVVLATSLIVFWIFPFNSVEASKDRDFSQSPVRILQTVKENANADKSEQVQKTQLDETTSKKCVDIGTDSRFTFTRTLCYIKNNSWSYLQYMMFIWLTVATILIIWNWFKLVTSPDREKQMSAFKKNIIYIAIWVTLLLGFYYFLDIYVWIINLFSD